MLFPRKSFMCRNKVLRSMLSFILSEKLTTRELLLFYSFLMLSFIWDTLNS